MNTHPTTHENIDRELETIQEILKNNHYKQRIIDSIQKQNLTPKIHRRHREQSGPTSHTYYGPERRTITKLF
jgi:hypothetical protein